MTLREIAIKAMQELGYSEQRIANMLAYMDSVDPKQIGTSPEQVQLGDEAVAMEKARNYFRKYSSLPMDN